MADTQCQIQEKERGWTAMNGLCVWPHLSKHSHTVCINPWMKRRECGSIGLLWDVTAQCCFAELSWSLELTLVWVAHPISKIVGLPGVSLTCSHWNLQGRHPAAPSTVLGTILLTIFILCLSLHLFLSPKLWPIQLLTTIYVMIHGSTVCIIHVTV